MTESAEIPSTVSSTDGVTIKVHDLGGTGELLVMAHATGFCGPMWAPMAETLGQRFHCVAFDYRAHGASTRPERSLAWDGMAADVTAVIEAISPGRPVRAVGHSMGGGTLALAEAARPGLLSGAWLFEPIVAPRPAPGIGPQPSPLSEGARRRRADFASRDEAFDRYRAKPPLSLLDERALRAYVEHGFRERPEGGVTLSCRPQDEAEVFEHFAAGGFEALGSVAVPLRLATGQPDVPPADLSLAAAEHYPNIELCPYPQLSHFGPLEAPEFLANECLEWFEKTGC